MPPSADTLWRALSDPTRRALFETLTREGAQPVKALTATVEISQPAVSRHLSVLAEAGLVHPRKDGREIHYSADLAALAPIVGWARQMTAFWDQRLDDLDQLLKRMDQ